MYKIKITILCAICLFAGIAGIAKAQTIGTLLGASLGNSLPPPIATGDAPPQAPLFSAQEQPGAQARPQIKSGTFLVGIFTSKDAAQAEFDIGGRAQYFGVGDHFKDGWIIDKINPSSVELKKCSNSNRCSRKTMQFSGA